MTLKDHIIRRLANAVKLREERDRLEADVELWRRRHNETAHDLLCDLHTAVDRAIRDLKMRYAVDTRGENRPLGSRNRQRLETRRRG